MLCCKPRVAKNRGKTINRFVKYILPLVLWMCLMFMMSTSAGSSVVSEHILLKFLHLWNPDITPKVLEHLNAVARKCAHLTEYAILAVLLYRALHQGYQRKMTQAFRFTVAFSIVFASLDEFHQSFTASRTPSGWDVMIDATGAIIGIGVLTLIHRNSHRPHRYIVH
ncbi:MAG: VanZ family protein [Armatimonadota bacterium]